MRTREEIERENVALGIKIGPREQVLIIGHAPFPQHLLREICEPVAQMASLANQRSDFLDSGPETWWGKLSDRGKQNAQELFDLCLKGYHRCEKAAWEPIISTRCLEISPALLQGGWPTDTEMEEILRVSCLALAGLFDGQEISVAGIIERLIGVVIALGDLCEWLEAELQADVASLESFAEFLAGRSTTYTDAILEFYLPHAPANTLEKWFTEISTNAVRDVLAHPLIDPPYPNKLLRLHLLSHLIIDQPKDTTKRIDRQLTRSIKEGFREKARFTHYYKQLQRGVEMVAAHDPVKALQLSLLLESEETGIPVTELARMLPGGFDEIDVSKRVSRLRNKLDGISETDPYLTFLRKIGRA
jgi:hypothetical protein